MFNLSIFFLSFFSLTPSFFPLKGEGDRLHDIIHADYIMVYVYYNYSFTSLLAASVN